MKRTLKRLAISKSAILKDSSRSCINTLSRYRAPPQPRRFPKSRTAAVLVALFVGRMGDLYVLLSRSSRRSTSLKSYAGDTSLPGGKWDDQDKSLEDTARREAFEEIGLPRDEAIAPLLCILEPFLARNMLIVTPVVVLVTDPTLEPVLNGPEVESLFSHPLYSFLTTDPPFTSDAILPGETRDMSYSQDDYPYHSYTDAQLAGSPIRLHRFLTGRESEGIKPVFGLTSAILIRVAQIGYQKHPAFTIRAPGQPTHQERIEAAMHLDGPLRKAALEEGLGEWYHSEPDPKPRL